MTESLFPELKSDPVFRALSLWQPHAQAIALGLKTYETRGWSTAWRGTLAIHAALKKFRHEEYPLDWYQTACSSLKRAGCPQYALRYGEVVCLVDVVDCVPTAEVRGRIGVREFWGDFRDVGDDGKPRFAFKLENPRKVWPPVKVSGRQGWFSVTLPAGNEAVTAGDRETAGVRRED